MIHIQLRQVESSYQKYCHLVAGHNGLGTEDTVAAACGDPFSCERFDPVGGPIIGWHIGKDTSRSGRSVGIAVFCAQQEYR